MSAASPPSRLRVFLAWCVHFYTALGLACAAGITVLVFRGDDTSFRLAFGLMALATVVDATDGTFARMVRVKEVLPGFDGAKLDDLIDFHTYVTLPLLLVWRAGLLPAGHEPALLLPLFAAGYGFSQTSAKTSDGYFLGFPSYWNVVAFYLYTLPLRSTWAATLLVATLALLTFVPARYLYPSQRGRLNLITTLLAVPWLVMLLAVTWLWPDTPAGTLALASLYFPVYYLLVSWAVTLKRGARQG